MAIIEINNNGKHGPVIMCDVCNKRIEKTDECHVIYKEATDCSIEKQVLFAHAEECHKRLEDQLGKVYGGWNHLEHYIYWLLQNIGYESPEQHLFSMPDGEGGYDLINL